MEILTEITKDVFEKHIPAAKMPERNSSVYNRMQEQFTESYNFLITYIVSAALEASLDSNDSLKRSCIRFVCLNAFIRTCRSLDLVLTATGFGIVSTDSTAPASKTRVDALVEELTINRFLTVDDIIRQLITVSGWGETYESRQYIQTLFYSPRYLQQHTTLPMTSENWKKANGLAITADAFLRRVVSNEYMDALLDRTRKGTLTNDDRIVVDKCNRFTGAFISGYDECKSPNKVQLDAIMEYLETYSSRYPEYEQSEVYHARHAQRYENRKEDPSFFFM